MIFNFFKKNTDAQKTQKPKSQIVVYNQNSGSSLFDKDTVVDIETLYRLYAKTGDIQGSVRLIHESTARDGFSIVNAEDELKPPDVEQSKVLIEFFKGFITFGKFVRLLLVDVCRSGNSFFNIMKSKGGHPIGLQYFDPRTAFVVSDKYGNVIEYIQKINSQEIVRIPKEDVLHIIKEEQADNIMMGLSPIESIVKDAETELASQDVSFAFYENHGVPAHLMIFEEDLSQEQMDETMKMVKDKFSGADNKFRAGAIPYLKDIKTVTPSQKDQQFIESKMLTTKKIASAFKVDTFLLGYTDGVQRGNSTEIVKKFYRDTIEPYNRMIEDKINTHLLPSLGLDRIKIKINRTDYTDESEKYTRSRDDVKSGIITANEAREIRGMQGHDNELADELMVNGVILDDVLDDTLDVLAKTVEEQETKAEMKQTKVRNLLDNGTKSHKKTE